MTKQEEIRDTMITNIVKACPEMLNVDIVKLADRIIQDEATQGVVIKIKAGVDLTTVLSGRTLVTNFSEITKAIRKAGYVAVEPLIKVGVVRK